MTPEDLLTDAVIPALKELGGILDTPGAAVLMLAWCMQESGPDLKTRVQKGRKTNPALGLPQLEYGDKAMTSLVIAKTVEFREWLLANGHDPNDPESVRQAAKDDDKLAVMIARLGAYYSPKPMPAMGDAKAAWALYYDAARPGKPRPEKWQANYDRAVAAWKAKGLKPMSQSRTLAATSTGALTTVAGGVWAGIEMAQGRNIEPQWVLAGCAVLLVLMLAIKLFRLDDRLHGRA